MFSKARQITRVTATRDMPNMGMAKYQSCVTNFQNSCMNGPTLPRAGDEKALQWRGVSQQGLRNAHLAQRSTKLKPCRMANSFYPGCMDFTRGVLELG